VAGRTPHEAYNNFIQPLQQAVSCVTDAVLVVRGGGYYPRDEPFALTIGDGAAVSIEALRGTRFGLSIAQQYRIVEDATTLGPWKITTVAYEYALLTDTDGEEIFSYHWHPRGRSPITTPHFHLGHGARVERADVADAHFPTSRIALEEFLRCIIRDFQVMPQREDWQKVLDITQQAFEDYRTWP
jgi:hypothetical protein